MLVRGAVDVKRPGSNRARVTLFGEGSMRARSWIAIVMGAAACGPVVGGVTVGTGDGSTSTTSPVESSTSSGASGTSSTSTSETTDATADSSNGVTTRSESEDVLHCVEGTFVGIYNGDYEYFDFTPCDGGERAWFEPQGGFIECAGAWIVVEGTMCGPGSYGQLLKYNYSLSGDIVDGPCVATCDVEDPPDEQCGSFDLVCSHIDCLPEASSCGVGARCIPSSVSGAPPWSSSSCVPESRQPQPIGGTCTSVSPWNDDCASGGYCDAGVCKQVCAGDLDCADGELCRPCEVAPPDDRFGPFLAFGICSVDPLAC